MKGGEQIHEPSGHWYLRIRRRPRSHRTIPWSRFNTTKPLPLTSIRHPTIRKLRHYNLDSSRTMSSSQAFQASSPMSAGEPRRRKSKFTYRQLSQLTLSATSCPLRVIAHVDLDAFYAQCEMVRLGIKEDQPLAVQQWWVVSTFVIPIPGFPSSILLSLWTWCENLLIGDEPGKV